MNVLIIFGHPRHNSLSAALGHSYAAGATKAGYTVECLHLCELTFDPNVVAITPHLQEDEPCILKARQLIIWADHIVFVYPTWWGTMPALLKGFIDRVFISGFAFNEIEGGTGYEPLLTGKTAELITTMDTPKLIYRLYYKSPGHNAMGKAILGFCGFTITSITSFATVRHSTAEQREKWVQQVYQKGLALSDGAITKTKKAKLKIFAWLKALRLQFYPMTFIAYTMGAYAAIANGQYLNLTTFWIGYLFLFFAEVTTVFSNELYDYRSDMLNKKYGPFNGGSRVIVSGQLNAREIRFGIFTGCALTLATVVLLLFQTSDPLYTILLCACVFIIAVGYTVPPLKLVYRGAGELTVAFTHSFAVILCGYAFQGAFLSDDLPWVISLPLFLSVFPSIILAGIPDYLADASVNKKTIAVKWGAKRAAMIALLFTVLPALLILSFTIANIYPSIFRNMVYGIVPHAMLLGMLLIRYIKDNGRAERIDMLIITALTYLMWFAIVPLVNLK